jgi:pyruvyltransferase
MTEPIRLYWWRHSSGVLHNFGDELSPHLVSLVSGRPVEWAPVETCELIAVGSVLGHVLRGPVSSAPAIWGGGFISADRVASCERLTASAVRGRLSAARVGGSPALGDPALLSRYLVPPADERSGIGLVPHYMDFFHPLVRHFSQLVRHGKVISPLQHPQDVLAQIASCDVVLSSSLHGLIVADSMRIPNRWVELSDAVVGAGYNFRDYYSSYDIYDPAPIRMEAVDDVQRAVADAMCDDDERSGLDDLVAGLIVSFPALS